MVKEELSWLLFVDDMLVYAEDFKESTKKLLKLSDFGKFSEHKINIQKLHALLYNSNERMEVKTRNVILSTITQKQIKYLVLIY